MFSRILGVPVLLAAAIGVPYVATNGTDLQEWLPSWPTATSSAAPSQSSEPEARIAPSPQGPGATLYPTATRLEGQPSVSLADVFRFDVTKEWVYQHWARKSTGLAELGYFGIRVPLVTGTQLHDVAGSLTYYFDAAGQVQRILFRGNTADTTQLVRLATQRHGLQRQATPIVGEQLLQVRRGEQVFSELRTRPASVLWASSPHDSFSVEMELQRPGVTTPLPSRRFKLPVVATPPPPENQARQQPSGDRPQATVKQESGREKWKAFFPRSRVPKKQVDSLDKRDRFW